MKFNPKLLQSPEFLSEVKELKLRIKHHFKIPKEEKLSLESLKSAVEKAVSFPKSMLLDTIGGVEVWYKPGQLDFRSALEVDVDGSPNAYNPEDTGLDWNANAKDSEGNWVGVYTVYGDPVIQDENDPAPRFYVSTTSYQNKKYHPSSPDRYLNAEEIPYFVLPPKIIKAVPEIVLGSRFQATNLEHAGDSKFIIGMIGDVGPNNQIGEASMKTCVELGVNPNPKKGGTSDKIIKVTVSLGSQWQAQYPLQKYGS